MGPLTRKAEFTPSNTNNWKFLNGNGVVIDDITVVDVKWDVP